MWLSARRSGVAGTRPTLTHNLARVDESKERPEKPDPNRGEASEESSPGFLKRLKQHAKDAVVAGTSTHGGVAGGVGGRKSRKKQ